MALGPEKILENRILDWLNSIRGCFAFKINTGGVFDPKTRRFRKNHSRHVHNGTHDILGVYEGQFFSIEVKAGYNKASTDQIKFKMNIEKANGYSLITNNFIECKKAFLIKFGKFTYKLSGVGEALLFDEEII